MWSFILACSLTCCGQGDANTPPPPEVVVQQAKQDLQTGSLIFSRGDCLAVKIFSRSAYTHVGGVVVKDGEAIVYDSMNGAGVRKTPFSEYLRQQTPSNVLIVHPKEAFSGDRSTAFEEHLESQLGRKYAVKHHLTGKRANGIHCSEYMTDALMAADAISPKDPPRVSPGSLLNAVVDENLYVRGGVVELRVPEPEPPKNERWYRSAWRNTAACCSTSSTQLRRWILCR